MKRSLLALILLLGISTAQAELLESNITVQMKTMHQLAPNNQVPTKISSTYKTTAFKTSDLITRIGEGIGKTFEKNARLIYRVVKTKTLNQTQLIIRDKKGDTEISFTTLNLNALDHHTGNDDAIVTKALYTPNSITIMNVGPGKLEIIPQNLGSVISMVGMSQQNSRSVLSKEFKDDGVALDLNSYSFTGWGSHNLYNIEFPNNRVIQGTFKISTPKVMPTPLE